MAQHEQILTAVKTVITALGFWDPLKIKVAKLDLRKLEECPGIPGVLITPIGNEQEDPTETNLHHYEIGYPVTVIQVYCDGDQDPEANLSDYLNQRQAIRDALFPQPGNLRVNGGPSNVCGVDWVPLPIVNTDRWLASGQFMSTQAFRVRCNEYLPQQV